MVKAPAPAGCYLLVFFDLFAGTVCCLWSAGSWPSAADSADTLAGVVTAGIAGTSMVVAGLCLRVRQPWNWQAGTIAQLVSGVAYATLATIAVSLGHRPNPGECGLDILGNLALCVAALAPAAVSFVGCVYLLCPPIKQAFGFEQH